MSENQTHALYISYFGLRQPLVQTQVIPYLQELVKGGIRVSLLTFEPDLKRSWDNEQIQKSHEELNEKGISWTCLAYHKSPSTIATAYDIFSAVRHIRKVIDREKIDVLHGRVHVATLMGAIARKLSKRKPKLIFDIRGFFPEEYTDAGVWAQNGILYRAAKRVERWLMDESDAFVVLTEKARQVLFPESAAGGLDRRGRPVEVVPCCVDLEKRFHRTDAAVREGFRSKYGFDGRYVAVHLGALGGLYLTEEIVAFLQAAREADPSLFALFLTQTDPARVTALLKQHKFAPKDFFVGQVDSSLVPGYLLASDVGLSFVKSTYATLSRSPTKIPEYLAAGLPIIANPGVGDVDDLISSENVGVLVQGFDRDAYMNALAGIKDLGEIRDRCRDAAKLNFDLSVIGGPRYRRLYERLLQG